jgi:beta-glucanase (GH16 family)
MRVRTTAARLSGLVLGAALLGAMAGTPAVLPSVAAETPAPYCGAAVAKPTGGTWTCTFADYFSGGTLDSTKWVPVTTASNGFTSAGECFLNRPENIRVGLGALRLTARRELVALTCSSPRGNFSTRYTGGYVTSWSKFAQTYGRYEIRAKFPSTETTGLHSALWLYPSTLTYGAWPASGEIDIAEFFTRYPDRVIPNLHYKRLTVDANVTNNYCMVTNPDTYHTYVLEWTPASITISYDGQVCLKTTAWYPDGLSMPAPFDKPFFLNLTQALGSGTNAYSTTTQLPGSTYVDYVKVWK